MKSQWAYTLTFLRITEVCQRQNVYLNVSSLNWNYWTHFEPRTKSAMLMPFMTVARRSLLAMWITVSIGTPSACWYTTLVHALHDVTHLPVKHATLTCHFSCSSLAQGCKNWWNPYGCWRPSQDFKLLTLPLTFRQLELADSGCLSICGCCTIFDTVHSAWLVLSVSKAALTL